MGIYEGYAQFDYDFICVSQPQLDIQGLFRAEERYFIVCKNLEDNSTAIDGTPIKKWVSDNTTAGLWIELVREIPEGTQFIPERSHLEFVDLVGKPRTWATIYTDLEMLLPKEFPDFSIKSEQRKIIVVTDAPLTTEHQKTFISLFKSFRNPIFEIVFTEQNSDLQNYAEISVDKIGLYSKRTVRKNFNLQISEFYEKDEDFWVDNRREILINHADPLKYSFKSDEKSRCLIDATSFSPRNIRIYLSIYEVLVIAIPVSEKYDEALQCLGVSEDELVELIRIKKVEPIFWQNLERYPVRFLEKLVEIDTHSVIMPRQLLSYVITDARIRNPLLFPTFGVRERKEVLKALYSEISQMPSGSEHELMKALLLSISDN